VGVRLHRIWHNLGHLYQHWLINIVIGFAIEVMLITAHNSIIVVAARNWALDTAMRGSAELATTSDATPSLAFIDVDEEAWRSPRWGGGEPFRAPRDGLMTLINYAFDNGARYVILDVIVDGRVDQDDRTFSDQIVERAARLEPDQYLLFVRTLREPLPGMEQLAPELRTSPLDQALRDQPNKQIFMVAPYFQVSRDGVLRDWRLWRAVCRRDAPDDGRGHWEILPSVQLVISALELARTEKRPQDRDAFPWRTAATTAKPCVVDVAAFAKDGAALPAKDTDQSASDWLHKQTELTGAKDLTPPSDDAIELTNRIFFSYRYPAPSNVHVIPAIRILEHSSPEADKRLADSFSKSVVVIGQSFEAAGDQHMTPLGTMPGSMVLVNSVKSMLKMKLLQPPSEVAEWMFLVVSIFVIGFIFARFTSLGATAVLLLTFVPALFIVNYLLLRIHIWMDFAVPLLGIFAHRTTAVIEEWVLARRHAGAPRSHD
jgi:CHASE2 domain-containing sensor protein